MPNSLLYPPLCPAQGSGTGLKISAKSSKTWNFHCQPQSASLIFLWRPSPYQQTPRWALSSQSGVHKTSPTSPPSSELPSELPSGQTLEAEEGRGSCSGPGSHLWGTSRAGEKGRVGLEGQGRVLGHHGENFQEDRPRPLLSHILSKYFLSFSHVPATVSGTEVTAMSVMTLLPEGDLQSERETMEERNN